MGYVMDPFSRVSERKTKKLRGKDMIEMHRSLVVDMPFDVKIDPEGMEKLLHPYKGYFISVKDVMYSIDEFYDVYRKLLVATHERNVGMTLLACEVTAF